MDKTKIKVGPVYLSKKGRLVTVTNMANGCVAWLQYGDDKARASSLETFANSVTDKEVWL